MLLKKLIENWVVVCKGGDYETLGKKHGIHGIIARVIRNRGVVGDEEIRLFLHGNLDDLPSPWLMKDMEKAVDILEKKIREHAKIRVIGDYDIDGVTGTYTLMKGLSRIGADVSTYIPHRVEDGYGIQGHLIEEAEKDGIDTIVTCDNGIAAAAEIASAKEKGMTVVVTDHHEIPFCETEGGRTVILPPADAILNPKQSDCGYPYKNICGAVVALKLVIALYERFHIPKEELEDYWEIAAIATVGDVMDLQGENRILVKEGLKRLPNTRNKGLRELIRANKLEGGRISAYHIGFVLGPCINASGRLQTAQLSLNLLNAGSSDEAEEIARKLTELNEERKSLTEKGKEEALFQVENTDIKNDRVLVVYLPDCHESLAGIIAGRLREQYNKPAIVLTKGETCIKGSGRSIETYSMYEELVKCADLMIKFGGHPMAAGLSLEEKNIDLLRKALNEKCTLTEEDLKLKIKIDAAMPLNYITENLVNQLALLEPCGKGNAKPLFAEKGLRVLDCRILGKNRNVAKVHLADSKGTVMEGMYFGDVEAFAAFASTNKPVSVTYYPEINRYQDRETLQIVIQNYC